MLAAILAPLWYGYMAKRRGRNIVGWAIIGLIVFGVLKLLTVLIALNATPATESEVTSLTVFLNILLLGGVFLGGFLIPRIRTETTGPPTGDAKRPAVEEVQLPVGPTESVTTRLASTKKYHSLFNRQTYGVNLYFALCLFLGMTLTNLAWYAIYSTVFDWAILPKATAWARYVVFDAILALLFLALSHSISKHWFFSFVWGGVYLAIVSTSIIIGRLIESKPLSVAFLLKPESLVENFVYGVLFPLSIIISVRVAGVRLWVFIVALTLYYAILGTIFKLMFESDVPWRLQDGAYWLVDGILMGILLYLGLYLSLRRRPMRAGA